MEHHKYVSSYDEPLSYLTPRMLLRRRLFPSFNPTPNALDEYLFSQLSEMNPNRRALLVFSNGDGGMVRRVDCEV